MRKAQAGCHFLQPAEDFLLFFRHVQCLYPFWQEELHYYLFPIILCRMLYDLPIYS